MSDYDDRGAYTPPSDRLAFDPRQPVRGGGPAPVTLIISGLVLASMVGGIFFLYRDGFRHRGAPALVGAPVADARTPAAPPADADANSAPAGLTIDKTASAAPPPAFGSPPPQPLPLPPVAQQVAQTAPATAATPPAAAPLPPVAKTAPPPQVVMLHPDEAPAATPPKKVATATSLTAEPKKVVASSEPKLAMVTPPRKVAAPPTAKLAAAAPAPERAAPKRAAPITIASLADAALAERARGERATHELNARAAAQTSFATPARHVAVTSDAKAAPSGPPTIAGATGWVQIGAFSSEAQADQGWRDLARSEPTMAGKGRAVQPFTRDDGAILYRAYVTGFTSVSAAQSFCSELRAAGKACIVK